jgi:hypothetical protein
VTFVLVPLARPAWRWSAARDLEANALEAGKLWRASPCDIVFSEATTTPAHSRATWLHRALSPAPLRSTVRRVARLELEAELASLVLRARAIRAASPDRAWPAELPGLDSAVCPGERWLHERRADGSMRNSCWQADPLERDDERLAFTAPP